MTHRGQNPGRLSDYFPGSPMRVSATEPMPEDEPAETLSGRAVRSSDCLHDDECDCELVSLCPACGQPIDYCQGHGENGDPDGWALLQRHDSEDHSDCHTEGCDWAHAYAEEHGHAGWEAPSRSCSHCMNTEKGEL